MQKFVTVLLDQSGSMQSIKDDTIGGYNAFVKGLRESDPDAHFTFMLFDTNAVEVRHRAIPAKDVPDLTPDAYKPAAGTPLIDACMKAIKATEERAGNAVGVVVVIQTDGQENSSTEFTWNDLQQKVKEKTGAGWLFIFLGANIDAFDQGGAAGFGAGQTMSYNSRDTLANAVAYDSTTRVTRSYFRAGGGAAGQSVSSFTAEEKTSAGVGLPEDWTGAKAQAQQPPITAAEKRPKPIVDDIVI